VVTTLMAAVEADPQLEITVDVERLTVSAPKVGIEATFPLDAGTQERFLEGLDEIGISLRHIGEIADFETGRPGFKPRITA
jgi:3-isopropylmalate/(R)-2-methylmalate dehydratase small subunit